MVTIIERAICLGYLGLEQAVTYTQAGGAEAPKVVLKALFKMAKIAMGN